MNEEKNATPPPPPSDAAAFVHTHTLPNSIVWHHLIYQVKDTTKYLLSPPSSNPHFFPVKVTKSTILPNFNREEIGKYAKKTNCIGTWTIFRSSVKWNFTKVILVSTSLSIAAIHIYVLPNISDVVLQTGVLKVGF